MTVPAGAMEKIKINMPVICEGRYDKIKLQSILDARIVTTDGFAIFNAEEKRALLRKMAEKTPLLVLTDPDGAGRLIRSHLRGILPPDRVIHLYVPETPGKEKRKKAPSKEGLLGVEGIDADLLRGLFAPYADGAEARSESSANVTKSRFYEDGFSGSEGASERRAALARELSLPSSMSANALIEAINLTCTADDYLRAVAAINA